jgi:Ca2+-binding RTX toxin-like protein
VKAKRPILSVIIAVLCSVLLWTPEATAASLTGSDLAEDAIFGTDQPDTLRGLAMDDVLSAKGNPASVIRRRNGRRRRVPTPDVLEGGAGIDLLLLGRGPDVADGGAGIDRLVDEDGTAGDVLRGGTDGDTILSADGAADKIECGDGKDLVFADPADTTTGCEIVVAYDVNGSADGVTWEYGTSGVDSLSEPTESFVFLLGLAGGDTLTGNSQTTTMSGGPGADTYTGGSGFDVMYDDDGTVGDTLSGNGGTDLIYSADGAVDTITCGAGIDDTVIADLDDVINVGAGCEQVFRGAGQINNSPVAIP